MLASDETECRSKCVDVAGGIQGCCEWDFREWCIFVPSEKTKLSGCYAASVECTITEGVESVIIDDMNTIDIFYGVVLLK